MKKPLLIFALKCSVILYFAACTGINNYTNAIAAAPLVTKGTWKVNLFTSNNIDDTRELTGYILTFNTSGKITASKNGETITGNWSEDEIQNRITINLDTNDHVLTKLNNNWNISSVNRTKVNLSNTDNPYNGRLQITSL